jgi:electron transport complex protein RnfB
LTTLADRIDALLPQTQCTRCGYPDCRRYADALAAGTADIDRCPPGGDDTAHALAALLGREAKPVDPAYGVMPAVPTVAFIDEAACIGCFKCVPACPVDAIVGSPKRMHTAIASECNGCELCLPVCPVDCIAMVPRAASLPAPATLADRWRERYAAHTVRLVRTRAARDEARRQRRESALKAKAQTIDIAAAIARARARRRKIGEDAQ